jgi:TM2 domain-containing membrane protein YozV
MQGSSFDKTTCRQASAYVAAALSTVPGLGQIYNGEVRKGFLYFCSGAPSFVLVALIFHKGTLVDLAKFIAANSHIHVNSTLLNCLNVLDFRSPQTIVLCLLLSAFSFFCIKDALEIELRSQQTELDSSERLKISEATSGSYVLHAVLLAAMLVLGLFIFVPPEIKKQAVEIEFTSEQSETLKPHASASRQKNDTADNNVKQNPIKQNSPAAKPQAKLEKKLETRSETHSPAPPKPPKPSLHASKLIVPPQPLPALAMQTPAIITPIPQPTRATPPPTVPNLPQPLLALSTIPSQYSPAPLLSDSKPANSPAQPDAQPFPSPMPASIFESMTGAPAPIMPAGLQDALQQTSDYLAPQPTPMQTPTSTSLPLPIPIPIPIPDDAPWTINSSYFGEQLAPDLMSFSTAGYTRISALRPIAAASSYAYTAPPSVRYRESAPKVWLSDFPNYGPYLEQLRFRIKHYRIQPTSSGRIVVSFKIHVNGELTNLQVDEFNGDFDAEKEALKSVKDATSCIPPPRAPEMILWTMPKGSEEQTEIKFTFEGASLTGQVGSVKSVKN